MSRRSTIRHSKFDALEVEFQALLVSCLHECVSGLWGLFGQNDHLDPEGKYWRWPESKRLREMAHEIQEIRAEFGSANWLCDRFLHLRSLRGWNVPGEPKLAGQLLEEIEAGHDQV
jgi:hypothetical protein